MQRSPTRRFDPASINDVQRAINDAEKAAAKDSKGELFVWMSFDKLRGLKDKSGKKRVEIKKIGSGVNANVFSICPQGKSGVLWKDCMVAKPRCTNPNKCGDTDDRFLKDVTFEEGVATKRLSDLGSRNIMRVYHLTPKEGSKNVSGAVIYMEALGPWKVSPTVGNVQQARSLTKPEWVSVMFQMLFAMAKIQKEFPGFRHNDFHAGNLMLTRWGQTSPTYKINGQCFTFPPSRPRAVVIDFGWSVQERRNAGLGVRDRWDEIKSHWSGHTKETRYIAGSGTSRRQQSRDFALGTKANDWADIVCLCFNARRYTKAPWKMLQQLLFTGTSTSKAERESIIAMMEENDTRYHRLSTPAQNELQRLVKAGKVSTLVNAFKSDLFDPLRVTCMFASGASMETL